MTTFAMQQAAKCPPFFTPVARRYHEVSTMYERTSFNLVVGGILALCGLALLGNIILLAVTGKGANELWGIITTGMGGLVGLLANPPRKEESPTPLPIEKGIKKP